MAHTGKPSPLQEELANRIPSNLVPIIPEHVIDAIRNTRETFDAGKEYTQKNRKAQLTLQGGEIHDLTRAYFEFDLTIGATGATYVRASNGIWNCIRMMEVKEGSRDVVVLDQYNMLTSILHRYTSHGANDNLYGPIWGIGTPIQRTAWGAVTRNYGIPIGLHCLTKQPIEAHGEIQHANIVIYLYFDAPEAWIETDGTNPTYTIQNLRIVSEELRMPSAYKMGSQMFHKSNTMKIMFDDFEVFEETFDEPQFTLDIAPARMGISSLFTIFIDASTRNDTTVDDKFETFYKNGMNTYQHRIGGKWVQESRVVFGNRYLPIEPYLEVQRVLGNLHGMGEFTEQTKIGIEEYNSGQAWMVALDLETSPVDPELFNNVSTHDQARIQIYCNFDTPLAVAPVTAITFVHYKSIWQFGQDQSSITVS